MSQHQSSDIPWDAGVMDAGYAHDRLKKPHLKYRYQVRAQLAVNAYKEFHPHHSDVRTLEMGAAEGLTLLQIARQFGFQGEFIGVELAEDLLAQAPTLPENVKLMQGNVMELPEELEDNSFDLCTCLAVLEHLPDPQTCLNEAFRILKPGGLFVATCPHPMWDQIAGFAGLVKDAYHMDHVTMKKMAVWAERAQFQPVITRPFMWVVSGFMPYFGVSLPIDFSLKLDAMLKKLGTLNLAYVNQALIAQKPFA
ncbi:MAG TPA: hypothetical protein DCE42_03920 [Myxococcales bacterium]|nr:hypothetical protein [Deltaproteobacteria bacterium]MBU53311.1 hypothetical protein [Deltaproteobacteria bacterium]HAA53873.1 hypothetical protein [Myxococcales bacterium]|tara:strand:+ start:18782 stop:19537 length:756 start_codon:yes stop_codon:yes gene_type:complete